MERIIWRKSSRSGSNGGSCVEVATLPGRVAVRDSTDPGGGVLGFTTVEFRALLHDIKQGAYDPA